MMAQPHGVRLVATPQRDRTTKAEIANMHEIPCLTTSATVEEVALQKDVEQIQVCCRRLLGKLDSAGELEEVRAQLLEAQAYSEAMTRLQEEHDQQIEAFKEEIEKNKQGFQEEMDELKEEHDNQRQQLENELAQCKQQFAEAEIQLGRLRVQHETHLQEERRNRKEQLQEAELHLGHLKVYEQKLEEERSTRLRELQEVQEHCEELGRQAAAQFAQEHRRHEKELQDELLRCTENFQQEIANKDAALNEMQLEVSMQLQGREEEREKDKTKVRLLEDELSKSKAVIATQTSELKELEAALADMREQAQKQEIAHVNKYKELQETVHTTEMINSELQAKRVEAARLAKSEKHLQKSLDDLTAQIHEYQQEHERLSTRVNVSGDADGEVDPQDNGKLVSPLELKIERWQRHMDFMHEHNLKKFEDADEGLRAQNSELMHTVRQFNQDCEFLEAENCSLKASMSVFEEDLERVTDQHARLIGHVNHRQKIRYTMKLKEEINRLFDELKKARKRIVQLEVSKDTESVLDVLESIGASLGPSKSPLKIRQGTPGKGPAQAPVLQPARTPMRRTAPSLGGQEEVCANLERAQRCCHDQERALEQISIDFQHLRVLIERVVHVAGSDAGLNSRGPASTFPALLQQLRDVIGRKFRHAACQEQAYKPDETQAGVGESEWRSGRP